MSILFGNGIALGGQRITGLADPSSNSDAATKSYVDAFVRGLSWKQSVRVASTTNITLSAPGASHDGVSFSSGDSFLAKNQTTASENGIYDWNGSGVAATRRADADSAVELLGATVTVTEGTANADKVFRLVTDTVTLGSTSLSWTELGGGGSTYIAGTGLSESPAGTFNLAATAAGAGMTHTSGVLNVIAGNGITVNADDVALASSTAGAGLTYTSGVLDVVAGTGITVAADSISLAATAAGAGMTHTSGVLNVIAGNGITVNADDVALASSTAGAGLTYTSGVLAVVGGTGITVAADLVSIDTSVAVTKYSTNVGDNSSTSIVVTHSLGTKDVIVSLMDNTTPFATVMCDVEHNSTSQVTLKFAVAPTTNQYRVTVHA